MPGKIWAHWEGWLGPNEPQKEIDFCQAEKYIRADIHAAEVERLRERINELESEYGYAEATRGQP